MWELIKLSLSLKLAVIGIGVALIPFGAVAALKWGRRKRGPRIEATGRADQFHGTPGGILPTKLEYLWDSFLDKLPDICVLVGLSAVFFLLAFQFLEDSQMKVVAPLTLFAAVGCTFLSARRIIAARSVLRQHREYRRGMRCDQEAISPPSSSGKR